MEGKILAAISDPDSAAYVGLYSIMLAKRTGMEACILIVAGKAGHVREGNGSGLNEKVRMLKEAGEAEGVKVECLIADGVFEDEVANHFKRLGGSILIVGDDCDLGDRRGRLRKIEKELAEGSGHGGNRMRQFFIVSRKGGNAMRLDAVHGCEAAKNQYKGGK